MPPFTRWRRIPPPPPPEKSPAAASRILVGAPARQPDLVRASRKSGGGAAEGSYSKVGNLPSKFGHARPLRSRIICYVRDGRTDREADGRTKATLISPFATVGGIIIIIIIVLQKIIMSIIVEL